MKDYNNELFKLRNDMKKSISQIKVYQSRLTESYSSAKYSLKKLKNSILRFQDTLIKFQKFNSNNTRKMLDDLYERED